LDKTLVVVGAICHPSTRLLLLMMMMMEVAADVGATAVTVVRVVITGPGVWDSFSCSSFKDLGFYREVQAVTGVRKVQGLVIQSVIRVLWKKGRF
jgi:hypothetical protein